MSKWELPKDPQFYNWESPVNLISQYVDEQIKEMHKQEEKTIMAEITHKLGVNVNKDELIKALNYDREQYDKGYYDGVRETFNAELEEIKAELEKLEYDDFDCNSVLPAWKVYNIIDKHIHSRENCCDTCTHKGYDCDNDFWVDCEQYDGEARADECDDKISRKKLLMYLNDYALAEAPDERTPDVAKEYTAKDMQMMVYRTIRDCMRAVEEMKGE